ncbi:GNAT family N-acetyltransferase [Psychrobacillus sp. NPDC096426]|uniref:GNAT family N-acetyltransferase n=1 Tax=Psychrobacillus sp. NPDC096426 TaxID=3364491 RepID=UPI00380C4E60
MGEFKVKEINDLLTDDIFHLVQESKIEGFHFLDRLTNDYKGGTNTFSEPGEFLVGAYNKYGAQVAVGGLNIDPFSDCQKIGRLRRFYVGKDYRRNGIGTVLLKDIVSKATCYYDVLVLHTDTIKADKFYTAFGFVKDSKYPNTTHFLNLQ